MNYFKNSIMKIILTGGTGFVGSNLSKFLQDNALNDITNLNFREELPHILDGDVLIHLAGKAHDLANSSKPEEYFEINFTKTKHLFDLFLRSNVHDFIYFSSVKAVADSVVGILTEDVYPSQSNTPYGYSKWEAEQYLLSKELPANKRLFILRPCMIHGPGNKGNLNLLYSMVKKGVPYPLGTFENRRSYLSIYNLLYILKRLIEERSIPGGIYNVADDEPLSTNSLVKLISEASHVKGAIWHIPKRIIIGLARLGDKFHFPLNSERLKKLTESYVVSNKKLKNVLGIESFPISSTEGIKRTICSFRT